MSYRTYIIITILLLVTSCSEDTPSEPTPVPKQKTPMLTIELLTPSPEVGQPVEFKVTISDTPLVAPTYEWDFGDGSVITTTDSDTTRYIYTSEGTYTVKVHLIDTVANIDLEDSISISVIDNRPVWQRWSTATISLFSTMRGMTDQQHFPDSMRKIVRKDYLYTRTIEPLETIPFNGTKESKMMWNQNGFTYESGSIQIASAFLTFKVSFSNDAGKIDSLSYAFSGGYSGIFSSSSKTNFVVHSIDAVTPISEDSTIYLVQGESTIDKIMDFVDIYTSNKQPGYTYDTIDRTPNMYFEVRFYKK